MLSSRSSQQIEQNRQKRYDRYCEVMKLHRAGVSMLGIIVDPKIKTRIRLVLK
jgi:hypothetical protein